MEAGLREVCRSVRIGKILIQRVGQFLLAPVRLLKYYRMKTRHAQSCFTPR